jgi:hypothetical protein
MQGEATLKSIAERVLGASRADETEVVLSANESALTRFGRRRYDQSSR